MEKESQPNEETVDDQLGTIRKLAEDRDVTFELGQYFHQQLREEDPEIIEIQRQGFISASAEWLRSMRPEEMKYGKYSK